MLPDSFRQAMLQPLIQDVELFSAPDERGHPFSPIDEIGDAG